MGSLTLPKSGIVYADTQVIIYSVQRYPDYSAILEPLWQTLRTGRLKLVTSQLTVMEALVGPIKHNDEELLAIYDELLSGTEIRLIRISLPILRLAAKLRAETSLRTPDAIHAASALSEHCDTFITNDAAFRRVEGLQVQVLNEVLAG